MVHPKCWEEWCNKELLVTLESKGKIKPHVTEARAARMRAQASTHEHLFPQRDPTAPGNRAAGPAPKGEGEAAAPAPPSSERAALKARLKQLSSEFAIEKEARVKLEDELKLLKGGAPPT
mmetsp:Transcript_31591/g.102974  ORF Transcript_31591/g.102974 Transcript_31591/m.102974 type:complete len:120 (+) Transcript_31591:125-484(+)